MYCIYMPDKHSLLYEVHREADLLFSNYEVSAWPVKRDKFRIALFTNKDDAYYIITANKYAIKFPSGGIVLNASNNHLFKIIPYSRNIILDDLYVLHLLRKI